MDHFTYHEGALFAEQTPARSIADAVGTPVYVYSKQTLIDHFRRFADAFTALDPLICYSIKSCSNLSVCRLLGEHGAGMDLVSGGELHRAQLAGVDPADCVFAGVGKTDAELTEALNAGVGWFNIESAQEFEVLAELARELGRPCRAALRVNPDVDARTHRHTTTGTRDTKFGVDIDRAEDFFAAHGANEHCRVTGLHVHLGSPIYSPQPYASALLRIVTLIESLQRRGHTIDMINIGGGFGADYTTDQTPQASVYAQTIVPMLRPLVERGVRIALEPGRTLVANAGILLLRVMFTKTTGSRTFVICDGGMNVLIRPCHYDAFHFIWPCNVRPEHVPPRRAETLDLPGLAPVDVVGPICETGDFLARDRALPPIERGDLLAVFGAGAYGMVMASRYNSRPMPAEVLVDGRTVTLCRRREHYDDLVAHERQPQRINVDTAGQPTDRAAHTSAERATTA